MVVGRHVHELAQALRCSCSEPHVRSHVRCQYRTSVPLDECLGEQRILAKVVALFQDLVNELQAVVEFLHHASNPA